MRLIDIEQGTPEWHEWRAGGIGASEAPVIMGESPYQTPAGLWAIKVGLVEPEDLSRNPHVRRGNEFEEEALEAFIDEYGIIVMPTCGQHDLYPFVRSSFDGLGTDEVTEVKCPAPTHEWWSEIEQLIEELDGVDVLKAINLYHYFGQVQHQLMTADLEQGNLWVYNTETKKGYRIILPADKAYQTELQEKEIQFWNWVEQREQPPLDPDRDEYRPHDSLEGEELEAYLEAEHNWLKLEAERAELDKQLKAVKAKQGKEADTLVELIGNHMKAVTEEGVNITRFAKRGTVDWEAVTRDIVGDEGEIPDDMVEARRRSGSNQIKVTAATAKKKKAAQDKSEAA